VEKNNRWIFILSHQQPSVKMGEYSVATNNRFALTIDEDEDLYEPLKNKRRKRRGKRSLLLKKLLKLKLHSRRENLQNQPNQMQKGS